MKTIWLAMAFGLLAWSQSPELEKLQAVNLLRCTHDGLHPNDAGYQLIEPLAEKAIAAALR